MRSDQTPGWRFVAAESGGASGYAQTSPRGDSTLTIEHATYAEISRWERTTPVANSGMVVLASGRVKASGACLRRASPDVWEDGVQIVLEAIANSGTLGWISIAQVGQSFRPELTDANGEADLALALPAGTEIARISCQFAGQGSVQFSNVKMTIESADPVNLNKRLVDRLVSDGAIRSLDVEAAFRHVLRHHFVPAATPSDAYRDIVVPTHYDDATGACISSSSQPTIMAIMLEQLRMHAGMRVLEIGAGTGYNAALIGAIVGDGHVWTVDIDQQYCREVRANLARAEAVNVDVVCGDGWKGYANEAPYDRIVVTASAYDIAPAWFNQLRDRGRLVLPLGYPNSRQRSVAFRKDGNRLVMEENVFCGFMPMRGEYETAPLPVGDTSVDWLYSGQPRENPASLVAYPHGSDVKLRPGEELVRREWFDYVVTWG
jgi:protein-L-isoaspartate(D-aspartate) O-methyltransferase